MKNMVTNDNIRKLLSLAYILGGSPCSGKSTLAERLVAKYQLEHYKLDDCQSDHLQRCRSNRQPIMWRVSKFSWGELFTQPISEQVAEELAFYAERFEMILEDLRAYDPQPPVVLEGAALLPELIHHYPVDPGRGLYLIPTLEFQFHHYELRPWIKNILKVCENPEQAFNNWMMRDHHFEQEIIRQAKIYRYPFRTVDDSTGIDEMYKMVSRIIGFNSHEKSIHQVAKTQSPDGN